jgi:8-oxo-dGTP diphosphatase
MSQKHLYFRPAAIKEQTRANLRCHVRSFVRMELFMPFPKTPSLTADCVVVDPVRGVLMVRRKNPPFKDHLALPGGFVDIGETVEDGAKRELVEETGLEATDLKLVGVYSRPDRDPRGHTCSVVYLAKVRNTDAKAGDDAAAVEWINDFDGVEIAFDHREIITDALNLIR